MIVVHFDVLATPSDSFATRQPSIEGRRLWNTFFASHNGHMIVTADSDMTEAKVSEWLRIEGYKASIVHVASDFHRSSTSPRAHSVWHLSSVFGKVKWYIDVDAKCCAEVLSMGIPTLLVAIPQFQRPEWHTPSRTTPWDEVVEELDKQALKKAEKTWGDV